MRQLRREIVRREFGRMGDQTRIVEIIIFHFVGEFSDILDSGNIWFAFTE